MIQTEKMSHDERVKIAVDEDYLTQLAKALRYWKASRSLSPKAMILFATGLVSAIGILFFTNISLLLIIPAVLLLVAFFYQQKRKAVDDTIIWDIVESHYLYKGFNLNMDPVDSDTDLQMYELSELIDISLDRFRIVPNRKIEFSTNNGMGYVFQCIGETQSTDEKGNIRYQTVFDGVVIKMTGHINTTHQSSANIQISPVSKLGRLFQDTISSISNHFSDVRFSNEDLNEVFVLKTEGMFDRADKNEWIAQRFSTNMEEVIYQMYDHYGKFHMRVAGHKIWVAFPSGSFAADILSRSGRFDRFMLPTQALNADNFHPKKWGHLMYVIGLFESMFFHLKEMLGHVDEHQIQLASDFDYLIKNFADLDDEELRQRFNEFKKLINVPKILSDEQVAKYQKEYMER